MIPDETADAVRDALAKGITLFVVSGVFSPTRSSQEAQVEQIIKEVCHSCGCSDSVVIVKVPSVDTSGSARDTADCTVLTCCLHHSRSCCTHPWQLSAACCLASGLRLRLTVLLPVAAAGIADIHVTLSHEVGHIGLLEREAAAILNAALRPLASRVIPAIQQALKDSGIRAPLQLTSNDGTLILADMAQKVGHHARLPSAILFLQ